ncbi:MAG: transporter [Chloroflexi bacterium]|nr:transporter [Chloroflexota bacterium]
MAWQIYELTGSALQLGLIGLARAVPTIALLLFGGLLADAVNRRHLMMMAEVGQLLVAVALAACSLLDLVSPILLYTVSASLALFSALESPARAATVPNLVPRDELTNAVAMTSSVRYLATVVGPSLAGLIIAATGPALCYLVEGGTRFVGLITLVLMRPVAQAASGRRAMSLTSLHEGIAFVWTHPVMLWLMALDLVQNFFGSARTLLPIYAKDILFVGPEGLGVLYSATAIGALGMALIMGTMGRLQRPGRWVLISVGLYGIFTAVFAMSGSFWLSCLMLAAAGAANSVSNVSRGTINQLITPDELRGRVTGVNSMFTTTGPPLGQFSAGAMAALLGPQTGPLAGALLIVGVAAGVASIARPVRRFEIDQLDSVKEPGRAG